MPVPKTNLFQGDRVRLSDRYLVTYEILSDERDNQGGRNKGTIARARERRGTIVSDTLRSIASCITVHWDGNTKANRKDVYMPDELTLVEDEEALAA